MLTGTGGGRQREDHTSVSDVTVRLGNLREEGSELRLLLIPSYEVVPPYSENAISGDSIALLFSCQNNTTSSF